VPAVVKTADGREVLVREAWEAAKREAVEAVADWG